MHTKLNIRTASRTRTVRPNARSAKFDQVYLANMFKTSPLRVCFTHLSVMPLQASSRSKGKVIYSNAADFSDDTPLEMCWVQGGRLQGTHPSSRNAAPGNKWLHTFILSYGSFSTPEHHLSFICEPVIWRSTADTL